MANSYFAQSYEDWKKHWTKTDGTLDTDSMTDTDKALGMYLEGLDKQSAAADSQYESTMSSLQKSYASGKDTLNTAYNTSLSQLNASKKTSEQNADILHQKMQKYLGTQADASGLSGTGYASPESLKLRANAQYSQNLGNIAESYNESKASLDNQKLSGLSDLESAYMTGEEQAQATKNAAESELEANKTNKLLSLYTAEQESNAQEVEDGYTDAYNKGASALTNQSGTEALAYIESIKDSLQSEDYEYLKALANSKIKTESETSADANAAATSESQAQYYNQAVTALNNMTGAQALAYIDSIKDNMDASQYQFVRSLALSQIASDNEASDAETQSELEAESQTKYQVFVSGINNGYFATEDDAIQWAKDNGIEDYLDVKALASTIGKSNETQVTNDQATAYEEVYGILSYETDADEAWATLDSYKDKISDAQYQTLENILESSFGARDAVTYAKFQNGTAVNGYTFDRVATNTVLENKKFLDAVEDLVGERDAASSALKDGDVITVTKGDYKGQTYMYFGGVWCKVNKTQTATAPDSATVSKFASQWDNYRY